VRVAFFASQLAQSVIVRSSAAGHGLIHRRNPPGRTKPAIRSKQSDFMRVATARAQLQDVLMHRRAESRELLGETHYPLNIQNNRKPELVSYARYLKSVRKAYKAKYLAAGANK
jgi:hypothetical protein